MSRVAPRRINALAAPTAASWGWVTHAALVVALAVVVARVLTPDVVREPWSVAPGGDVSGGGPGPATGLAFDLLAAVPALLVLARRCLDRDYRLLARPSHLLLLALTLWLAASVAWSSDRFLAVVSAGHWAGGACLLWAASQLVRSWDRLRVAAAVSLGLLLALAGHTALYRFVDVAESRQYWDQHKQQFLHERGWTPDSFEAVQFQRKLVSGEQTAFYNSANTLAAVGVLLAFAGAGLGLQRALDDRDPRWLALTAVAGAAGGWVLLVARSKTSLATPVLGTGVLLAYWRLAPLVRRWPGAAYAAAVAALGAIGLVVVGLGLARGGLFAGHFSNSLDFRWKYWTAAAGVFGEHPLLGVGWANFGGSYLAHRLPDAAEEIKDPHDFLVRFAAELGGVGLALALGWLLRLAWELTRPATETATTTAGKAERPVRVGVVGWVAVLGVGLSVVATVNPSLGLVDVLVLLLRPVLLLMAVLLGGIAGAMRSPQERAADARPGPWVFATLVVGLGLFLLHNLIDFAWFEPGPMFAFMTLAGAASGVAPAAVGTGTRGRAGAVGGLAIGVAVWLAVAAGVVVPIALAGQTSAAADDVVRAAPADHPAEAYRRAAAGYEAAADRVPYDADLWTRAARAAAAGGDGPSATRLVAAAERADPRLIDARLLDGDLRLAAGDAAGTRAAFGAAVRLNPGDVLIRLRYAKAMDRLGDRPAAVVQYRAALAADAALPVGEPRRLTDERVAQVRALAGE